MRTSQAEQPRSFISASVPKRLGNGEWELTAGPDWAQGRTLFGGLVGAAVAEAMTDLVPTDLSLRTLSISFAGPISPGSAQINTHLDKTGTATAFAGATVTQDGSIRTRAQAVFARTRGVDDRSSSTDPGDRHQFR